MWSDKLRRALGDASRAPRICPHLAHRLIDSTMVAVARPEFDAEGSDRRRPGS